MWQWVYAWMVQLTTVLVSLKLKMPSSAVQPCVHTPWSNECKPGHSSHIKTLSQALGLVKLTLCPTGTLFAIFHPRFKPWFSQLKLTMIFAIAKELPCCSPAMYSDHETWITGPPIFWHSHTIQILNRCLWAIKNVQVFFNIYIYTSCCSSIFFFGLSADMRASQIQALCYSDDITVPQITVSATSPMFSFTGPYATLLGLQVPWAN